ncbi:hypothetical protein DL764_006130 [Monosporascus ibericus]|uniref:DNA ligase ATP-dependent N-terminal domain-containing protein n=1 Tax=Monosporascus ibericus TaxID=155417 RepID=A0A4Q4T5P3_9PEZI|nr:hypothetical protein DL764_006130 [Monosporascus ibericus]
MISPEENHTLRPNNDLLATHCYEPARHPFLKDPPRLYSLYGISIALLKYRGETRTLRLDNELHSTKKQKEPSKAIIAGWFKEHRSRLTSVDNDASAVLSTLLPERRTDRVYCIQATRLHSIIGHALGLGYSRVLELRRHETPGSGGDLGDCVESILKSTPNPSQEQELSVEKIDAILGEIAAASRFSSPKIRASRQDCGEKYANRALGSIYVKLIVLDEYAVFSSYHVLLPQLLKVRDDLTITTAFLRHVNQSAGDSDRVVSVMKPKLGIKVGRQPWFKGRSIKNCLDMIRGRPVCVEQKIDGEYCQIHVDLSKGYHCIQVFSKSGKDSTNDRAALHSIKLKKECIQGWGDVGDFAVIGASYEAAAAKTCQIRNLKWTHFYIGCLQNRNQVKVGNEQARFMVVNIVELNETLMKTFLAHYKPEAVALEEQDMYELELHGTAHTKPPTVVFADPVIFDVRCFSFDKEPNSRYWSMRFPMVSKIHFDRSYIDAITFDDLQEAAKTAIEMPQQEDSQETRSWIRALEKTDPRGIAVDAISQDSTSSESTVSPRRIRAEERRREGNGAVEEDLRFAKPAYAKSPPALPTTPTSSALVPESTPDQFVGTVHVDAGRPETAKRRCNPADHRRDPKRHRTLDHSSEFAIPANSSQKHVTGLPLKARKPLGQINPNALSESASGDVDTERAYSLDKTPIARVKSVGNASPLPKQPSNMSPTASSSGRLIDGAAKEGGSPRQTEPRLPLEDRTATCTHVGEKCIFANKSVLLSPCIATYAWVTDTLLKEHGITEFIVDPTSWTRGKSSNSSGPRTRGSPTKRSRRNRVRKICLVESRRQEATHAFLKELEEANLQMKNGNREWVAVYDWRVLEKATELESGNRGVGNYDPWRQFYVGLA